MWLVANDWDGLSTFVGALADDEPFVEDCWNHAKLLVDKRIGDDTVPDEIVQQSYRDVGADLYWRRAARNGIVGINSMDSTPMRINRDPLASVEYLLAPFLSAGFA